MSRASDDHHDLCHDLYVEFVDEELRARDQRRATNDAELARAAVAALAELPRSQALPYLLALHTAARQRASALARAIEAACDHQIRRLAPSRPGA